MSKSLTPKQLYMINQLYHMSQTKMTFTDITNKEHIIYDPQSDFSKTYPNLSFLLDNSEYRLKDISEQTLKNIENTLVCIINNKCKDNDELSSIINKWFNGQLDKHFYYNELNDKMFIDYIISIDISKEEQT